MTKQQEKLCKKVIQLVGATQFDRLLKEIISASDGFSEGSISRLVVVDDKDVIYY